MKLLASAAPAPPSARALGRICLVRQGYYPLDTRVRREVQALVSEGHEVDVVCLTRPGEPRLERLGRVTVHRLPIPLRRAGVIHYLLQYGAFFLAASILVTALHAKRRFDVVQVNTMPDLLVFSALVPKLFGARILLDLHECMPEFYAVKFGTDLHHPAVRLLSWLEQSAIRFADFAITCTEQMKDAFVARGAGRSRVGIVMNSSNEEEFEPHEAGSVARMADEFRLICHGTVERIYGIDTIIRAVHVLRDEIPGLRLAIYGEGSALGEIRRLVGDLGLEGRVFISGRFAPIPELVDAIAAADVGVVAIRRDIFRDLTHCNKMYDFITMRKPAIVSRTSSVEAYFDEHCFRMFSAGDVQDLAQAIRELHASPRLRERLVRHATRANEPYRWPYQRRFYLEVVHRLILDRAPSTAGSRNAAHPELQA